MQSCSTPLLTANVDDVSNADYINFDASRTTHRLAVTVDDTHSIEQLIGNDMDDEVIIHGDGDDEDRCCRTKNSLKKLQSNETVCRYIIIDIQC